MAAWNRRRTLTGTAALHAPSTLAAAVIALLALAAPLTARTGIAAASQLEPSAPQRVKGRTAREEALNERIEQERSAHGPRSDGLIAPLTALGLFYEEEGEHALASAAFEQARQLVRVKYGLYSLEEAPLLRQLIRTASAEGDAVSVWALEKELLRLVDRNPNDSRTAPILREIGDRRIDVLRRYVSGAFPPEIVLGCYYNAGQTPSPDPWGSGSTGSCHAGSRRVVIRSLVAEAHSYYTEALETIIGNEGYSSEELPGFLHELVRIGYEYGDYSLAKEGLRHLAAFASENTDSPLGRTDAEIQLIDWKVLLYRLSHGTSGKYAPVLEQYRQAYARLVQDGAEPASVARIFAPAIPVVLPAFMPNPLVSEETPESTGYIDVAFVINEYGNAQRVEVLGASNAPREAEKRLVRVIKRSLFRPRIVDGRVDEDARVVLRYYLNGDREPGGTGREGVADSEAEQES